MLLVSDSLLYANGIFQRFLLVLTLSSYVLLAYGEAGSRLFACLKSLFVSQTF